MKKKILFFRNLYFMGGTEMAILNLIQKLDQNKFEIYIGYTDNNSSPELLERLKKYAVKSLNVLEESISVDVLINCSLSATTINSFKNIEYKRLFVWFHYFLNYEVSILSNAETLKQVDTVVTVSETTKNLILAQHNGNEVKDKIMVIHNPLDKDELLRRASLPIEANVDLSHELNLVTVSRLDMAKGFSRKVKLCESLDAKGIDYKWFIIGSSYYPEVEEEIKNMFSKFGDRVVFLGQQDNPFNLLKECDYLVTLSDDETWGLTITEAKLLGVPCIVSDFDVAFEQVEDKKNGIILSRENTDSYIDRIDDIIENKDFYKQSVKDFDYEIERIVSTWEEILQK